MNKLERTVTLEVGTEASNFSEAYRHECECRYVLDRLPDKWARNKWLYGNPNGVRDATGRINEAMVRRPSIGAARGLAAAERIRAGVMQIVEARKRGKAAP